MFNFDQSLVLMVGARRSGTTWLQRMLASHPHIVSGQESHLFSGYLGNWWQRWQGEQRQRMGAGRTIGLECYLDESEMLEEMRGFARRALGRVRESKPDARLIVEKTPEHGLHLPLIHKLFPDAKIIHVLRDGRDVVDSMLAAQNTAWGRAFAVETAEDAASQWDHYVRTVRRDQSLFTKCLEVRYEDLVDRGGEILAQVFDFVGAPLAAEETNAIFERWAMENSRSNAAEDSLVVPERLRAFKLEPRGFHRSGRPGAWQENLTAEQQQAVIDQAGALLEELGYAEMTPVEPLAEPGPYDMVSIASRDDAIWRHPKSLDVLKATNAQMLQRERLYLYATVFAYAPERTLEIGVCEGGSTRIIDAALRDVGGGTLISVDPCLQISQELREQLSQRVTFLEGASPGVLAEAMQVAGGPFQFVLVDGDHSKAGVIEDFRAVAEVTEPGAIILAHDAYFSEVSAAINEVVASDLPFMDVGIVSQTCHPMRQNGELYRWGGFRMLIRTQASAVVAGATLSGTSA